MKTLRIGVWVGLMIVALTLSGTVSAQPNLVVGSATGAPGETVNIPVTFTNNESVVGFQFDVQFNSTQFAVGALTDGPALSPHLRHSATPSGGTLRVLVRPEVSQTLPNINSGVIVNIPFTIDAGATPGTYDLTLTGVYFSDNAANLVSAGTLTNGQITIGAPDISVSPMALNFGAVKVGTSSPSKPITIYNTIAATANLVITEIEITRVNASEFSQTNNCSTLTPGSSCTANVTFAPASSGLREASLKITSNDPNSPLSVGLSGTGGTPQILVRRVILEENFSSGIPATWTNEDAWGTGCGRVIGSPFAVPWAIVDPNCGAVTDELLYTPYFDASSCGDVALLFSNQFSHGTTTTATVSVTGNHGKTWEDVATMISDDGYPTPNWKAVALSSLAGEDGSQIEFAYSTSGGFWAIDNVWVLCDPPDLSFKALVSSSSEPQTVMIRNTGTADLNVGPVSLTGTDASQFLISSDEACTGGPVAPSASCGVQVAFVPGSPGEKKANLSIASDDSDHPTIEVPLTGKGVVLLADPEQGTLGSELTIRGSGFGEKKGKVLIGGAALKVTEWKPDSIKGLLSKVVTLGSCQVAVQTKQKGAAPITEADAFSVETPKIWRVEPDHGGVNTSVTITGKYFGTKKGKVTIGGKSCKVVSWTMDARTGVSTIQFLVPKGLAPASYDLKVINKVGEGADSFTID